jgi:hypothetical protein
MSSTMRGFAYFRGKEIAIDIQELVPVQEMNELWSKKCAVLDALKHHLRRRKEVNLVLLFQQMSENPARSLFPFN